MENEITFPEDQAPLIRAALLRRGEKLEIAIAATIEICRRLATARARFSSDREFGIWMAENELDDINRTARAAALHLAEHLDQACDLMRETESVSFELTWERLRGQLKDIIPSPPSREGSVKFDTDRDQVENTGPRPSIAKREGTSSPRTPRRAPPSATTALERKFGASGASVSAWIKPTRKESKAGAAMARCLAKETIEQLATFLTERQGTLPPAFGGTEILDARVFWREMPLMLRDAVHNGKRDDEALAATMTKWDAGIAPVYKAWCNDKQPKDSDAWFIRYRRMQITAPVRSVEPAPLPALDTPREAHSEEKIMRLAPDSNEMWQIPAKEANIRVYGTDIWPIKEPHWHFRDAFIAYSLWCELDNLLEQAIPSPKERARAMLNPIQPILCNWQGRAGAALRMMLNAQFNDPERASDTVGPGKVLVMR